MVIVKLIGGLGNQMFQYAAAKALALEKKQTLIIDASAFEYYKKRAYELHIFKVKIKHLSFFVKLKVKILSFMGYLKIFEEKQFNYDPEFFNQKIKNVCLKGYFQSELYFKKYAQEIKSDFKLKATLKEQTIQTIAQMKQQNSVSLHIRRGDFLTVSMHNTNKTVYYKRATNYIETKVKQPVYYVFSDEIEWVKENFETQFETHFIDFNPDNTSFEDLILMSCCQHNIIANSSFSWWGAWLNENPDKLVVAPQNWFNDQTINYKDVVPQNWIKL